MFENTVNEVIMTIYFLKTKDCSAFIPRAQFDVFVLLFVSTVKIQNVIFKTVPDVCCGSSSVIQVLWFYSRYKKPVDIKTTSPRVHFSSRHPAAELQIMLNVPQTVT